MSDYESVRESPRSDRRGESKRDQGHKVYIGNLPKETRNLVSEDKLKDVFGQFGELLFVWIARNPPGFAYIHFEMEEDALRACEDMHGSMDYPELVDRSVFDKGLAVQMALSGEERSKRREANRLEGWNKKWGGNPPRPLPRGMGRGPTTRGGGRGGWDDRRGGYPPRDGRDPRGGGCFNCGRSGHRAAECRSRPSGRDRERDYGLGANGHSSYAMPVDSYGAAYNAYVAPPPIDPALDRYASYSSSRTDRDRDGDRYKKESRDGYGDDAYNKRSKRDDYRSRSRSRDKYASRGRY